MENFTRQEYEKLMELISERVEEIRLASYSDKEVAEEYNNLGMMIIKLKVHLEILDEKRLTLLNGQL